MPIRQETKNQKIPKFGTEHKEVEAEAKGRRMEPQQANTPEDDRDLGPGQGQQRGIKWTQETAADEGMRRGAYSQEADAGGWQVWTTSR